MESTPARRRTAPATVQLEDSVASHFANQVESDDTEERKVAIAESLWLKTAERQDVAREAESNSVLKMLSAHTDGSEEKAERLAVAEKEAGPKVNKNKARIIEAKTI